MTVFNINFRILYRHLDRTPSLTYVPPCGKLWYFFVVQVRQHRFLLEQPCRQPLKCVLGSLYFQKLNEFLFFLCFPEIHNPKVSRAKLSIVVRELLSCHGRKLFNISTNIIYQNLLLIYNRRYPQFQIPSTNRPGGRREPWK